jgi:PAT family beta-lactamase induction signal transducer AmpG
VAEINTKQASPLGWIASTWFAMGIPFIALSSSAAIMYQSFKLPDEEVAFWTSFILLPWALKFLWAPLLEMFKNKKYFVYVSQFFLGVLFALVAVSIISDRFFGLSIGLFTAIAVAAATQDLAADGIYINELNKFQQQQFIGWQTVFSQLAKAIFGSALVLLAFQLEEVYGLKIAWMTVMIIYAIAMITHGVITVNKLPTGGDAVHAVDSAPEAIVIYRDVLLQFLKKKNLWIGLLFIFLYRLAEAQVVKIAPFFFKASRIDGGLGIDKADTSFIFGVVGTIAFVLGSLASGYFVASKTFNRKTLLTLCAIMNIPLLVYSYLAITQPVDELPIILMVAFQQFCYGFGLLALVYYILQEIVPGRYQLAYFSFAAAAMNFAFIIPGMFSGYLSDYMGYYEFFIWVIICTVPAFIMSATVPLTNATDSSTAN